MASEVSSVNNDTHKKELPLLTFNSLYNLRREEKKNSYLQKLPGEFYEAVKKFIDDKKTEIVKLKNNEDISKFRKEQLILKNSKMIIEELIGIRSTKISKVALQNALSEEDALSTDSILEEEKKIYKTVQEEVKKLRSRVL